MAAHQILVSRIVDYIFKLDVMPFDRFMNILLEQFSKG